MVEENPLCLPTHHEVPERKLWLESAEVGNKNPLVRNPGEGAVHRVPARETWFALLKTALKVPPGVKRVPLPMNAEFLSLDVHIQHRLVRSARSTICMSCLASCGHACRVATICPANRGPASQRKSHIRHQTRQKLVTNVIIGKCGVPT